MFSMPAHLGGVLDTFLLAPRVDRSFDNECNGEAEEKIGQKRKPRQFVAQQHQVTARQRAWLQRGFVKGSS